MTDEHEVVHLRAEAIEPGRGVIIWSESVVLLDIGAQQSTPGLGRLTGPGLARVDDARHPDAELLDRVTSHARNVFGTLVGQPPLRVFVVGLGLPMLNEIEVHCRHGRTRLGRTSRGSPPG